MGRTSQFVWPDCQETLCLYQGLETNGILETLRYDATTTTLVLSSVVHTFSRFSIMSGLDPDLQFDHVVKINRS